MKKFASLLIAFAIAVPLLAQEEGGGTAKGAQVDTTGKGYTAAFVIEPSTKRVLYAENADVPLPTASMAKMMTLLIAMEEIQNGRLKLTDPVVTSARASKMGGSQIYAKEGQSFPVQTLLAATMVQSANDAAEMLAEKISGSPEAFADMMNDRARALGMTHSNFVDPHGLPNAKDPKHIDVASARDLAILGMELMKYPLMREYAKTFSMPFSNGTFTAGLTNPNHLINPHKVDYFADATGLKTGYSGPAGYCVTASARRGDMELVSVVMGARAPHGPLSSFGISSRLMSEAFAQYRRVPVVKKGQGVGQATVADGRTKVVPAVAGGDAFALVKRGEEKSVKTAFAPGVVTAPVRAGQQVGAIIVSQNGSIISRIPAIASASVDKQPWWRKFWPF
ncbi:MAG TPA: D-alanyl-D-alanine carboxypeptidase family protein [Thermoanaerobaculia bacterium]|nr:D-alanyl-D-alanine carboxypeptidase family protein [Thermoanaerobaculia bacterium]